MLFKIDKPSTPKNLSKFSGTVLGKQYGTTTRYLTKDGEPYICRMGEIHYSRLAEECWEEAILKMKKGGIDVIASYVFWIHHEEEEGNIRFDGNLNLKKFLALCKKHSLPFILRIGPWVHGEAKNGGFPDWLPLRTGGVLRTDNELYLSYVRRFFTRIYEEVSAHSDTILGIQIENELRGQLKYAEALKKMLLDIGFRAPYFTFTGWGGSDKIENCPAGEVLCLYGGYPEAPWMQDTEPIKNNVNFTFTPIRDDSNIGADIFAKTGYSTDQKEKAELIKNTPYLTCEIGGGNQITYHRRPVISTDDVYALTLCKLGSGANGLGYYVYHGGKNPVGKTTTMQESRLSDYPNDLPIISYDFQAPIGEAGQIRESYYKLNKLHRFIDLCEKQLATMTPFFPTEYSKSTISNTFSAAVRSDGESGFIFVNNYVRLSQSQEVKEVLSLNLPCEKEVSLQLTVKPGGYGIIPFKYKIGNTTVEWMSALPQHYENNVLYLAENKGIEPLISFNGENPQKIYSGMTVGDITLMLLPEEEIKVTTEQKITVQKEYTPHENSFFSHILNYDGTKPSLSNISVYSFILPKNTKYLRIRALGNIAALYLEDILISDYYLFGVDWIVDTRALPDSQKFTLQIVSLSDEDKEKIYFEYDMPTGEFVPEIFASANETMYQE